MPIAFFFGTLFTLQRLQGDSELVVMASAGYSLRQLAMPVLACAGDRDGADLCLRSYLMPAGQRALRDKVLDIRADMAGALLNEGEFNTPQQGLTVFIRQMSSNGEIRGILVHDSRDRARPVTYIAEKGILAQTPAGTRLIMLDGTIETSAKGGKQLQVLHFESYTINLDQFSGPARNTLRKINERYLSELLWPPEHRASPSASATSSSPKRITASSQPLYCLAFALIALAAVMRGPAPARQRRHAADHGRPGGGGPAHRRLWRDGPGAAQSAAGGAVLSAAAAGRGGGHRRAGGLYARRLAGARVRAMRSGA